MDNTLLLTSVAKHIQLTPDEASYFTSLLPYKKLKRKQFLLEERAIDNKLPFVTSGCLSSYAIDAIEDTEFTFMMKPDYENLLVKVPKFERFLAFNNNP